MISRILLVLWLLGLTLAAGFAQDRPNILLIMADDLGYSDLGSYGGEVETPHLNRLAENGLRFTDFYNTGRCCPSRASLLTGLYPHQAGMGWMTASDLQLPAYQGELNESSTTIAEVLSTAGYGTYMVGKWHLTRYDHEQNDSPKSSWPRQRGFDHFYGSLRGGSYYAPDTLTNDNERISPPSEGYFYTNAISGAAKGYIEKHHKATPNKPFFCYVAYTAPHFPLHAPEQDIAKYRERYAKGWDVLRQERYLRMLQMRMLEPNWSLPPRPQSVPAWDSLEPEQQQNSVERMAIYAAQIEGMDRGIGQILQTLEATRQLDNTLILFLADNGGTAEGGNFGFERNPGATLGSANSFASYGQGWATLSNTPFREYKHWVHEGGIATPFIAHWPRGIIARGRVNTSPTHLIDIMPTCVELARANYPSKRLDYTLPMLEGQSMTGLFKGMSSARDALYWEHEGHRATRRQNWKLVAKFEQPWELYHLDQDRTETRNVASQYPGVVKDLSARWNAYAKRTDVLPLDGRPWNQRVPAAVAATNATSNLPTDPSLPNAALLPPRPEKPNIVVILCDDLGYGDLGCFGSSKHRTPNIDRMAEEGALLASFYSTSGVCTPSRSSILTGCYPRRVSMHMNHLPPGTSTMRQVLFPVARKGLHPNEITIADALKERGYATACVGKWHLGDQKVFLPTRQGFDQYFGIPYSNDMGTEQFPINPPLPLLRNEEVIEAPVDQSTLTRRYTEEAMDFIRKHQADPFFLYLPHTMPHNPVHVSEEFKGQSENGLYADCVEEIDWSTGQILSILQELNLSEKTLVIFTSDNGAAKQWGGSNAPLSGFKGSVMEGGMRVPCVVHWPGQIRAGLRSLELTSTLDLFPTLVALTGAELPTDRHIDGKDIWPILSGVEDAASPHSVFYYYRQDQLQAIRAGKWKLHLPLAPVSPNPDASAKSPPRLYNLEIDIAERENVADKHPEVTAELMDLADIAREDLGDKEQAGKGVRPAGLVDRPVPLVKTE